jgi:uncharacterized membrane protein YkvA (DUF1232 family)
MTSPDMAGEPLPPASGATPPSVVDDLLRDYHDARRREDQWRIPQLLLALVTPVLALISVLFALGHQDDYSVISGAVAIVTATGAALIAIEVWRWHRTAIGIANRVREEFPGEAALLLKDPL